MIRARWLLSLAVVATAALTGCGSSHHAAAVHHAATASKLPPQAKTPYASSQPASTGRVQAANLSGNTVASLGFELTRDGFSFENYSFVAGAELDAHAMRELFGDQVCADAPSDNCTLTEPAQQWAAQTSAEMEGGHCYGFSMTALRFFTHNLSPSTFGAPTVYQLPFSSTLQSEIAYGWANQTLTDVQNQIVHLTPTQTLRFLEQAMAKGQTYTMGILNQSDGHAVTPIAIIDHGGGKFGIEIYDNNFPGVPREIAVDTNADTWSYYGATTPGVDAYQWDGQGTNNPMLLEPLSAIEHQHACPFCTTGAGGAGGNRMLRVTLTGNPDQHGHLLIRTADGHEIGYANGRLVNTIPGARAFVPQLTQDWKAHPEPIYLVPDTGALQVTLQGAGATGHDKAAVQVTGPGFGASILGLVPSAGSTDRISLGAGGRSLSVSASGGSGPAPTVQLAGTSGRTSTEAVVTPKAFGSGARVTVSLASSSNRLSVSTAGAAQTAPVALTVQRATPSGGTSVHKAGVNLSSSRPTAFTLGLNRTS